MTFGIALRMLKEKRKVTRNVTAWNESFIYIENNKIYKEYGSNGKYEYIPSQDDLLSEDWIEHK